MHFHGRANVGIVAWCIMGSVLTVSGCATTRGGLRGELEALQLGPVTFTNAPLSKVIERINNVWIRANKDSVRPGITYSTKQWIDRSASLQGFEQETDDLIERFVALHPLRADLPADRVYILAKSMSAWELLETAALCQSVDMEIVLTSQEVLLRPVPTYECAAYRLSAEYIRTKDLTGTNIERLFDSAGRIGSKPSLAKRIEGTDVLLLVTTPSDHEYLRLATSKAAKPEISIMSCSAVDRVRPERPEGLKADAGANDASRTNILASPVP